MLCHEFATLHQQLHTSAESSDILFPSSQSSPCKAYERRHWGSSTAVDTDVTLRFECKYYLHSQAYANFFFIICEWDYICKHYQAEINDPWPFHLAQLLPQSVVPFLCAPLPNVVSPWGLLPFWRSAASDLYHSLAKQWYPFILSPGTTCVYLAQTVLSGGRSLPICHTSPWALCILQLPAPHSESFLQMHNSAETCKAVFFSSTLGSSGDMQLD